MPLSRGRKKGKKKKPQKKKIVNRDYEEFDSNGTKIYREGKNLFIKTNRSELQQKDLIENIKKHRPEILKSMNDSIIRVIDIFSSYNNFQLLGGLGYNLYLNHDNPEDDGASELILEYGLSFATAIKGNPQKEATSEIINELIDSLYNIRMFYNQFIMTEFVEKKHSEIENHLRFKTMLESLFIRGDGYTQHIYQIYEELFSGHDEFLLKHYAFKSSDILETIKQLEDSFYARIILPNRMPHFKSFERFEAWQKSKGLTYFRMGDDKPMIDFLNDNKDLAENGKPAAYSITDIKSYNQLYKIRVRKSIHLKVVEALCIKFEDNFDFLNPKYAGLQLNESLSAIKPIILHENDYYLFAFNELTRNIFSITEKLILDTDKTYYEQKYLGNSYAKSRDNYLENKTSELFGRFIPKSKSFLNLKYKPGQLDAARNKIETELDLLLISEKANYIIEMKAGGLSAPSKRGALKSLTGQLADTIGYGAYQSHRAYKYLTEDPAPKFYDSKGAVVAIDKNKKIFRITITLEHLAGFIASMHELKILGIVKNEVEFAWTSSLFDLMIFSEIIENEDEFIVYLEKRLPLYNNPNINVDDEIDFLGYFLENGELIDKKTLKKVTTYKLNKTSQDIDNYFQKGGIKPSRKR